MAKRSLTQLYIIVISMHFTLYYPPVWNGLIYFFGMCCSAGRTDLDTCSSSNSNNNDDVKTKGFVIAVVILAIVCAALVLALVYSELKKGAKKVIPRRVEHPV